eukprot:gene1955-biopygen1607
MKRTSINDAFSFTELSGALAPLPTGIAWGPAGVFNEQRRHISTAVSVCIACGDAPTSHHLFNGCRFSFAGEELVYNPWSMVQTLYLYNKRIKLHWIGTGMVDDLLLKRLKQEEKKEIHCATALEEWLSDSATLRDGDLESVCLGPGTFTLNGCEMGYLTLKEKLAATNKDSREWKVGCPNKEVRHAVANYVIPMLQENKLSINKVEETYTHPMLAALTDGNVEEFIEHSFDGILFESRPWGESSRGLEYPAKERQ